jgi:hypothetical protein
VGSGAILPDENPEMSEVLRRRQSWEPPSPPPAVIFHDVDGPEKVSGPPQGLDITSRSSVLRMAVEGINLDLYWELLGFFWPVGEEAW